MEDYLLRKKGLFHVPMFKATSRDNTFEKDPEDCPKVEVLTFQKNAKSIFSRDNFTLCSILRRILRIFLKRDVSASSLNEPGFGIVSTKPLPICLFQRHVRSHENDGYRSNLKGKLKCSDLNIPRCK
ncbi:hypothetical protein SESBI_27421 [Sesbania bispinosa]|nr:hypothetical protein SESBI_27421 [Sesbania bispinosa]